jgi:hypothetical protein
MASGPQQPHSRFEQQLTVPSGQQKSVFSQ